MKKIKIFYRQSENAINNWAEKNNVDIINVLMGKDRIILHYEEEKQN